MFSAMHDLRWALRRLREAPGFAAAAIVTLALGIGANTAMFTVIDSVLIRPMPFPQPDRLVTVGQPDRSGDFGATSWPNLQDLRRESRTLLNISGYVDDSAILQHAGTGKTLLGTKVTCNLLDTLGVQPVLGHGFSDADCAAGASPTVLLSHRLWREEFAADPHIVGKQVRIGNVPHTVVGVMPSSFAFPEEAGAGSASKGIWLPSRVTKEIQGRGFIFYQMIGRLRPGVNIGQAGAEVTRIAADIRRANPKQTNQLAFRLRSYRETVTGAASSVCYALAAALGLVLLIACANVANLQLSRSLARHQELAVRAALGASRSRLVWELTVESGVLSLLGAGAGLALASGILQLLQLLPEDLIPRANEIQLRWGVLAALAAFATAATVLSSVIPALFVIRADPQEALRGTGRGVTQHLARKRMAGWLVISEVAIAGILLVGSSLLFRSLYNLQHKPLGFAVANVVTFTATPPNSAGYLSGASGTKTGVAPAATLYTLLLSRLRALPGVQQAALASSLPLDDMNLGSSFEFEGHSNKSAEEQQKQNANLRVMSGGYMKAAGTPVLQGRPISDEDGPDAPFIMVVNEAFAQKFFRGKNPLTQRLSFGGKDTGMEKAYAVVGVIANSAQHNLVDEPVPEVDLPYLQIPEHSAFYSILLESATKFILHVEPNQNVIAGVRTVVRRTVPGFAIDDLQAMQATVDKADFNQRLGLYLTAAFAGTAVLMVIIGLYGVLSQLVSQRRQEIGLRMALGATRASILAMVLRQGVLLITTGMLVGLAAAGVLGRTIQSFLYGVAPLDLLSFGATATALLAVGCLAALLPARRAAAIPPIEALYAE